MGFRNMRRQHFAALAALGSAAALGAALPTILSARAAPSKPAMTMPKAVAAARASSARSIAAASPARTRYRLVPVRTPCLQFYAWWLDDAGEVLCDLSSPDEVKLVDTKSDGTYGLWHMDGNRFVSMNLDKYDDLSGSVSNDNFSDLDVSSDGRVVIDRPKLKESLTYEVLWQKGVVSPLPKGSRPVKINDHGQLLCRFEKYSDFEDEDGGAKHTGTPDSYAYFYLWSPGNQQKIKMPGPNFFWPVDLSNSGYVLGVEQRYDWENGGRSWPDMGHWRRWVTHAVTWKDGVWNSIDFSQGLPDIGRTSGFVPGNKAGDSGVNMNHLHINSAGTVLASIGLFFPHGPGAEHSFVCNVSDRSDRRRLTEVGRYGDDVDALAINDRGQVIGQYKSAETKWNARAFVWQNGIMVDLNKVMAEKTPEILTYAISINNRGWILCEGTDPRSPDDPLKNGQFVLIPTDAPVE